MYRYKRVKEEQCNRAIYLPNYNISGSVKLNKLEKITFVVDPMMDLAVNWPLPRPGLSHKGPKAFWAGLSKDI